MSEPAPETPRKLTEEHFVKLDELVGELEKYLYALQRKGEITEQGFDLLDEMRVNLYVSIDVLRHNGSIDSLVRVCRRNI